MEIKRYLKINGADWMGIRLCFSRLNQHTWGTNSNNKTIKMENLKTHKKSFGRKKFLKEFYNLWDTSFCSLVTINVTLTRDNRSAFVSFDKINLIQIIYYHVPGEGD